LQTHYQYPLTTYFMHAHKRVWSNKPYQHLPYELQAQYQHLLTVYFMHTQKADSIKQATPEPIIVIANTISASTYPLFCAHIKRVRQIKLYQHLPYSLQKQYQHLLTNYFMHTKRVGSSRPHQHPSYSL
jgi:hypothetical protein